MAWTSQFMTIQSPTWAFTIQLDFMKMDIEMTDPLTRYLSVPQQHPDADHSTSPSRLPTPVSVLPAPRHRSTSSSACKRVEPKPEPTSEAESSVHSTCSPPRLPTPI
ncbi:hypothetical protein PM082_014092 [Marasmius tenuissimus]|nr:hypothetical protein PM082_014092 [Marasmius tenuissimus]